MKKIILLLISGLLVNTITIADTRMVIEAQDAKLDFWMNDKYFRGTPTYKNKSAENPIPEGDLFGDIRSGKMYMINEKEKIMIDLSNPMPMQMPMNIPGMPMPPKLKIVYKNKGTGKTIAGLKTTKYDIIVQGKKCFELLLTKNKAYSSAMKKYNSVDSSTGDAQNLCEQAENQMADKFDDKYGYVVKSINSSGQVEMLLKEFKTNLKAPKKYLAYPKGYKVMTIMDAMAKAMSEGKVNYDSK